MKKRLVLFMASMVLTIVSVSAQCVMCSKTASELNDSSAKGLNGGILYLAAIPLLLIGTVGYVWWKHNRNVSGQ